MLQKTLINEVDNIKISRTISQIRDTDDITYGEWTRS